MTRLKERSERPYQHHAYRFQAAASDGGSWTEATVISPSALLTLFTNGVFHRVVQVVPGLMVVLALEREHQEQLVLLAQMVV